MTERMTVRQLSLFKGKRQKGERPKPAPEFPIACMIADDMAAFGRPGWRWTHLPMGELRSVKTGARLKRMGTQAGWPDYVFISPMGQHHYLELKRRGGRLSEAQVDFQAFCRAANVPHHVAYGYLDAMAQLTAWGALKNAVVGPKHVLLEALR